MHGALRSAIAFNMKGIVAQKLLPSIQDEVGRVPTVEVMMFTPTVRKLILEEEDSKLPDAIRIGAEEGMQDFTMSLKSLVDKELIDRPTAFERRTERRSPEDGTQRHRRLPAGNSLMFRSLLAHRRAAGVLLLADLAWAQGSEWPEFPFDGGNQNAIPRGPGGYLSWLKLLPILLLYLLWVKTTDWVNRDCQLLGLPYSVWNVAVYASFLVGLALVVTIPVFVAGISLLGLSYVTPLGIYVWKRNSEVDLHERVLTPSHIRHLFSQAAGGVGMSIASEGKAAYEKGAPVQFKPEGGDTKQKQANLIAARQSPGFQNAKELVAELVQQRADKCMLDYSPDTVALRYQIDGVWHESEGQEREAGDMMLAVFKRLANLNVEERRKRMTGRFTADYNEKTYGAILISQGTQTGERVILQLDRPHSAFKSLRELGMREKMEEQLRQMVTRPRGLFLFSSPPQGGLTTTVRLALGLTDRYMNDFVAFQDEASPEPLAENIELTTFSSAKGDVPQKILESMLRREPNAVVVHEWPNAETAQMLCDHALQDKLVLTTVRAKEAVEALLRVLLFKVPASLFAPAVFGVLNQRLIRRLCDNCKQAYEPAPQLLQKLGIPAGRVEHLYRPPEASEQDKVCPVCNGIGYFDRTAIFELLTVDDRMRQVLEQQPKLDVLRKVSRQAGNHTLQQEGILLVAQGITSVQELSRVLKQ